jgi:hypothetical protein
MADETADVLALLHEYMDKRTTGQLDVSRRLDFLVGELGSVKESAHRIDSIEDRLQQLDMLLQSFVKLIDGAQEDFDTRTAVVLRDAEQLRGTLREAMMVFQKAQEDQNSDWDDKWLALRKDVERIEARLDKRDSEATAVVVSKIGRSERVMIALIAALGSLGGMLLTLLLQQAGR